MKLRVWWIPQIPMKRFFVPVEGFVQAKLILEVLAHYDLFQLENNIKPDFANVGGLEVWNGDRNGDPQDPNPGWEEWNDYDQADQCATYGTIDDIDDARAEELDRRNNISNLL